MNVYRGYFKVTTGPLMDALSECDQINTAAHEEYKQILSDIGASSQYYHQNGRLVGLIFDKSPDEAIFKKKWTEGWFPKKNTKAGKEIAKRIDAVKTKNIQDCLKIIGLSGLLFVCGSEGKGYHATLLVIPEKPPVVYVTVPWFDEDPEKIAEYIADKSTGKRFSSNMEAILWEPTADMEEVREWQVKKHIDEWNQKIKEAA